MRLTLNEFLCTVEDCCKKLEARLLTEHKQQMAEVGRHLRDRDALIQQFESEIQVFDYKLVACVLC